MVHRHSCSIARVLNHSHSVIQNSTLKLFRKRFSTSLHSRWRHLRQHFCAYRILVIPGDKVTAGLACIRLFSNQVKQILSWTSTTYSVHDLQSGARSTSLKIGLSLLYRLMLLFNSLHNPNRIPYCVEMYTPRPPGCTKEMNTFWMACWFICR